MKLPVLAHSWWNAHKPRWLTLWRWMVFSLAPVRMVKNRKSCPRWMQVTCGVLEQTLPSQVVWLMMRGPPGHASPKTLGLLISICVWCVRAYAGVCVCVCESYGTTLLSGTAFILETYLLWAFYSREEVETPQPRFTPWSTSCQTSRLLWCRCGRYLQASPLSSPNPVMGGFKCLWLTNTMTTSWARVGT